MSICLIQLLHYDAQEHMKKKRVLECKDCPFKDKCAEWVKENEGNIQNTNR